MAKFELILAVTLGTIWIEVCSKKHRSIYECVAERMNRVESFL